MKFTKTFEIHTGMTFEQLRTVEKSAKVFFETVAELGEAQMFNRGSKMIVEYDVEPVVEYGEITKTEYDTGRVDSKGRRIGYVAVYRDNGIDFRCYVQNTRDGKEFGVPQKSKSFKSTAQAKSYGAKTVEERISKMK